MTSKQTDPFAAALFAGPGEVRARCRSIDWRATPLGPVEGWPQALRTAVRICLDSLPPMALWAGSELTLLHNDAYSSVLRPEERSRALGVLGARLPPSCGRALATSFSGRW